MNLPNKLTIFRIILVPFFVCALLAQNFPHHYLIAFFLFAIASYTDHLDGKLARKYHLVTNFGKFLDPLADKILVISALVCFVYLNLSNVWFVLLIIAREFMVTSIRLVAVDSGVVIAANIWGKAKTVSQLLAILIIMLLQYANDLQVLPLSVEQCNFIGQILLGIATLFTIISGIIYLKENWKVITLSK